MPRQFNSIKLREFSHSAISPTLAALLLRDTPSSHYHKRMSAIARRTRHACTRRAEHATLEIDVIARLAKEGRGIVHRVVSYTRPELYASYPERRAAEPHDELSFASSVARRW